MDLHTKIFGPICFVLAVFAFSRAACATTEIQANPDYLSSGISWTTEGIPVIKIGDVLRFHYFSVGGMFLVPTFGTHKHQGFFLFFRLSRFEPRTTLRAEFHRIIHRCRFSLSIVPLKSFLVRTSN